MNGIRMRITFILRAVSMDREGRVVAVLRRYLNNGVHNSRDLRTTAITFSYWKFASLAKRPLVLGVIGMAKALEEQRRQPDIAPLGFEERFVLLVDREAT